MQHLLRLCFLFLIKRRRAIKSAAEQQFDALYATTNGFALSQHARTRANDKRVSLTYGEITFHTLHDIFDHVQPSPHARFYDCGAGVGKAVIGAALLHSLQESVGIECISSLCAAARNVATQYRGPTPVTFIEGDLFTVDWQAADIVFINATCFFGDDWQRLTVKCQQLKPGSQLIITSKSLPEPYFSLKNRALREMSWGAATLSIYLRTDFFSTNE